jgi:hypothetical protein
LLLSYMFCLLCFSPFLFSLFVMWNIDFFFCSDRCHDRGCLVLGPPVCVIVLNLIFYYSTTYDTSVASSSISDDSETTAENIYIPPLTSSCKYLPPNRCAIFFGNC